MFKCTLRKHIESTLQEGKNSQKPDILHNFFFHTTLTMFFLSLEKKLRVDVEVERKSLTLNPFSYPQIRFGYESHMTSYNFLWCVTGSSSVYENWVKYETSFWVYKAIIDILKVKFLHFLLLVSAKDVSFHQAYVLLSKEVFLLVLLAWSFIRVYFQHHSYAIFIILGVEHLMRLI